MTDSTAVPTNVPAANESAIPTTLATNEDASAPTAQETNAASTRAAVQTNGDAPAPAAKTSRRAGAQHANGRKQERDAASAPVSLSDPNLYLNRELSWIAFNERVFGEALDPEHPLLERAKFTAICHSNLDEYYMVRVSSLQQQVAAGVAELSADGLTATEQLNLLRAKVGPMLQKAATFFQNDLAPELKAAGLHILDYSELNREQLRAMRDYFREEIFPVLTPLALGPGHPFPHISNLSLNLAVVVRDPQVGERFARMKIPGVLPRFVPCPAPAGADPGHVYFVWLEALIMANLPMLFSGLQVVESHPFRVTRDADIEIQEDDASDLLRTVELGLQRRHFGDVCRLEVNTSMPERLRTLLVDHLLMDAADVYAIEGRLGLSDLMQIWKLDRPDLKDPPFVPSVPRELAENPKGILEVIANKDVIVHHPYDSFGPVIDFIETGAEDPDVLAIKQTLYRVGKNSPIVKLLAESRDDDTQVAVLVELKARFDEENNIEWARALEDAGVHVVYGLVGLKTHCKIALVVRKERDGKLKLYAHLGTGNYNPVTARIYTDLSYFTARGDITADVSELFNHLTGYSRQREYRKLLVAPVNMRDRLMELIAREAENAKAGRPARLILKTNTLTDEKIIEALYEAAIAGVRIDLIVRGVCCFKPGLPGLSENVRVVSVIGRFLEHSRIYYFHNAGDPQIYVGSADLMRRNLERRVEVLFPIEDPHLRTAIRQDVLEIYLRDTKKAHELQPDGSYTRVHPQDGEEPFSAQDWFLAQRSAQTDPATVLISSPSVKAR
jgi:polyphosphate kinase